MSKTRHFNTCCPFFYVRKRCGVSHNRVDCSVAVADSPVFLSWPRFYQGDASLREAIDGVPDPVEDENEFYVDFHPVSLGHNFYSSQTQGLAGPGPAATLRS